MYSSENKDSIKVWMVYNINFTSESGDIFQIQNLQNIVCLPSKSSLFQIQESQLYEDKGQKFMLTWYHYLAATLQLFHQHEMKSSKDNDPFNTKKHQSLFPSFPFKNLPKSTGTNTYFDFTDVEINSTRTNFGKNSADHLCRS